jgi:hypothetical protein
VTRARVRASVSVTGSLAEGGYQARWVEADPRRYDWHRTCKLEARRNLCLPVLCRSGVGEETSVELGIELEREVSPATYLWEHRPEFPEFADNAAVVAAIETGAALEGWQLDRARRSWRIVVDAAREAGYAARRDGVSPRRLLAAVDRVLDAVETVLFDGRLPPDLAARTARTSAKMAARAVQHALTAYWCVSGPDNGR